MEESPLHAARQPLQPLPATTTINRFGNSKTVDAQPLLSTGKSCPAFLTPPSTPVRPDVTRSATASDLGDLDRTSFEAMTLEPDVSLKAVESPLAPSSEEQRAWEQIGPRPCTESYWRIGSAATGYEQLGQGAWSIVYGATTGSELTSSSPNLPTPPSSPSSNAKKPAAAAFYAMKAASRRDAHPILLQEARILTYLHSFSNADDYLVHFFGYDFAAKALLLKAIPLNLDTQARTCLETARINFSTRTMFDPVIGVNEWQFLATHLIGGLAFLHRNRCIHGDIKPANILLQPSDGEKVTPLYCDFSSSHIIPSSSSQGQEKVELQDQQITALTRDFASPELLSSLTNRDQSPIATPASDIYALGVTLLIAATGSSPYESAGSEFLKLTMAKEGQPIEFARNGDQATRVMKRGMVERCLKGAVAKKVESRWTVEQWREEVRVGCEGGK